MAGLIRRVAVRQVCPLGPRAQNPERSVQDLAQVLPRPASAVLAPPILRQQRLDELPLGVCEIHSVIPWRGASDFREFAETGEPSVASTRNAVSGF
jgi:hypothetical protein